MYITIKSLTEEGEAALKRLMKDSSLGSATRTVVCTSPYTVHIIPKGFARFYNAVKNNPYAVAAIAEPMKQMMRDYGAKTNDVEVGVVF